MSDVSLYLPACSETTRARSVLPRQDRIIISPDLITYLKALKVPQPLASVPLFLLSGLPPPANSEELQHYRLLLFSFRDNDGCGQSVAVEVVCTCTEKGEQFKVCCRLKLRHTVSFGFTRRLASISSTPDTLVHFSHFPGKSLGSWVS